MKRQEMAAAAPSAAGDPIDLGDLHDHVGYALRRAQLAVFDDFIKSFAEIGMRPGQYSVLLAIDRNPGRKQSEIAEALGIQRPNFVAMLDQLEDRGLAQRTRSAADRRSHAITLTDKGRDLLAVARRTVANHEARMAAKIGPGNRAELIRLAWLLAT